MVHRRRFAKKAARAPREVRNNAPFPPRSPLLAPRSGFRVAPEFQRILKTARDEAQILGSSMEPEHLLLELLEAPDERCVAALAACGLDAAAVSTRLRAILTKRGEKRQGHASPQREALASKRIRVALEAASVAAVYESSSASRKEGVFQVETTHLLLGTLIDGRSVGARLLQQLGVTRSDIQSALLRSAERLEITLDEKSDRRLFDQIVDQVSEAAAAGSVSPGYRLPTIRQLADDLHIAPGTVSRAYAILEARGVVKTSGSQGTFVAQAQDGARAVVDDGKIRELLRSAVVAAYHAGVSADILSSTFKQAMQGIY